MGKPDGSHRLCVDFRKVNDITKTESWPLPRLDDLIDRVGNAKFIGTLDLLKGYWQIPLSDKAKKIATFVTPDGAYSFKVMPFGLKNAPSCFQRMMSELTSDLKGVEAYLDDVIVFAATWEGMMTSLEELFRRLKKARLTINLAKCRFLHQTVEYLGHIIGQGGVRSVPAKIEAMERVPPPKSRKQLMRFLGMASFYRRFCQNFSTMAAPLTDMLQRKRTFIWGEEQLRSFE